jgi:hypothetical protein
MNKKVVVRTLVVCYLKNHYAQLKLTKDQFLEVVFILEKTIIRLHLGVSKMVEN